MIVWARLRDMVAEQGAGALVTVHEVKGSAPREAGARMIVRPDGAFHGSVGGGQLEWQMLKLAGDMLSAGRPAARFFDQALGPDLGQCCGGRVKMLVETFDRSDSIAIEAMAQAEGEGPFEVQCRLKNGRVRRDVIGKTGAWRLSFGGEPWRERYGEDLTPVLLFGAGHVGRALVLALAPLPFAVQWIDDRDGAFPAHIPARTRPVPSRDPVAEVARAPQGAFVLVMTHDHALDLAITASALLRPFPYVGLIGSATKRARFEKRFRELGMPEERIGTLVSPIGIPDIKGKEPAIIAASVAAQLLQVRERVSGPAPAPAP